MQIEITEENFRELKTKLAYYEIHRENANLHLHDDDDDDDYSDEDDRIVFANEGSALRAETPYNLRIYPCDTCGGKNLLTREDVRLGYQCDTCADKQEGRGWGWGEY
jgi:hypothetical protein